MRVALYNYNFKVNEIKNCNKNSGSVNQRYTWSSSGFFCVIILQGMNGGKVK